MSISTTTEYPVYEQLVELLKGNNASFREVDHPAAGRSEEVAAARGTTLQQGAKAMVVYAPITKKLKRYYLAVLPSDLKIDFAKFANAVGQQKISFAHPDAAKKMTGCDMNTVPPFSFNSDLQLVVDRKLKGEVEIAFNAARLDRSIILNTEDYLRITGVDLSDISEDR